MIASRPSHATVIYPTVILNLDQILSIIMIPWRITEILLLYEYWSSGFPVVVIVVVILGWDIFPPLMIRATVPYLFLKDPSITMIAVPAWIDLALCLFYSLGGLELVITCVRDRVCGMVLEVMTNACVFYNILGEISCESRGAILCRVEVYITINFSETPVA